VQSLIQPNMVILVLHVEGNEKGYANGAYTRLIFCFVRSCPTAQIKTKQLQRQIKLIRPMTIVWLGNYRGLTDPTSINFISCVYFKSWRDVQYGF
jgi:hypothetical protein